MLKEFPVMIVICAKLIFYSTPTMPNNLDFPRLHSIGNATISSDIWRSPK